MFLYRERTGYVGSMELIQHVGIWHKNIFNKNADIMFYPYTPENVVDISGEGNDIEIYHYPHTRRDVIYFCGKKEAIIKSLLAEAKVKNPGRNTFSVDLEREVVLTDESFTCWIPSASFQFNLFIFEGAGGLSTFPVCYAISRQTENGAYKHLFSAQVFSSHNCMKPAGSATLYGKNLTYILGVSYNRGKFIGDKVPNLESIDMPTSPREKLPKFLKTDALEKFFDKCGIDKVKKSEEYTLFLPAPEEDIIDIIDVKTEDEVSREKETALRIQKQALDKSSISLVDLMGYGVKRVLEILPISDIILQVDLDIGGLCKRMCIYKGKVHVIPSVINTEWAFYLGADPDYFVECTEEDFPTYIN